MMADAAPEISLYRVTFHDGRSITLSEANASRAEADAKRQHPGGYVRAVKFLRRIVK